MRQGYYWPTMHADAKEEVDKCDSCQIHSPIPRLPKTHIQPSCHCPFIQWGWTILGTFDTSQRGALSLACQRRIVTDMSTVGNEAIQRVVTRFKIQQMNTSVAHPQANGLVERANRSLMEGIKTRLGRERAGKRHPGRDRQPIYQTLMIREYTMRWRQRFESRFVARERREAAAIREPSTKAKEGTGTITRGSAQLVLGLENSCIEGMKQAGWRMKESWDQIGRAHIESQKHSRMALTSCKQWMIR
ncbi:reverse transcriptase domain-containing protein [Tanacetum coccineum]